MVKNNWASNYPRNPAMTPVPLSIFRSNSKFDENSECSSFKYIRPITTIFCTRHDSVTVVTCAKYRCDRPYILHQSVLNFHRISNSIEICLVGRAPGPWLPAAIIRTRPSQDPHNSSQGGKVYWLLYSTLHVNGCDLILGNINYCHNK